MGPGRTNGGRLTGLVRRLLPDRNPLRRKADRIEAVVLAILLALFIGGAPLAALAAGGWAGAATQSTQRAQAGWQPVQATLTQGSPHAVGSRYQGMPQRLVQAAWTAPDGMRKTGKVYAPPGLRPGRHVTIWVDRLGHVVSVPLGGIDVMIRAALAGLLAVVLLAVVLGAAWLAARRVLDRRRLAAWDVGWAATGPQWTGRR